MQLKRLWADIIALSLPLSLCIPAVCSSPHRLGSTASVVLSDFDQIGAAGFKGFKAYLNTLRPPSVSLDFRSRVMAALPKQGEVQPVGKDALKLSAVQPILQYHDRSGSIEIKVIRVPQSFVGLYARSVILLSEVTLHLLTADELKALIAHELGHEYFWDAYHQAKAQQQYGRLQDIELRCDAVAILTLADLGVDPSKLLSAVDKGNRFNARFTGPDNAKLYPSESERADFIDAMVELARRLRER